MLPVTRLIGHKEYGNTPPGGYPGRKGDPRYSMDWRRSRVASFTPREDDMPISDADVERIAARAAELVWQKGLAQPDDEPGVKPAQAGTILAHTRAATKTISRQVSEVKTQLAVPADPPAV